MDAINIFRAENPEGRVDVARGVGSAATAMFIYDLAPGQSQSPYHYEYEEEWVLVVDGTVVVRTPEGEHLLERGDLVCFPSGPAGAHKLMNQSDTSARTLMFSSSRRACLQARHGRAVVGWRGRLGVTPDGLRDLGTGPCGRGCAPIQELIPPAHTNAREGYAHPLGHRLGVGA